jgi:hypothetical protein
MNITITLPVRAFVNIRVALLQQIGSQWKARRQMQKNYTVLIANRWYNQDIRDVIAGYRSMKDWQIAL